MGRKKQPRYIFNYFHYVFHPSFLLYLLYCSSGETGDVSCLYCNKPLFLQSVGTPLLPHQKQALSWMCVRENKSGLPPFWEKRGELYYNSLTCFSTKEIPERVRGGILADDMGLGKTLTTIALILTNFHNGKALPVETCVSVAVLNTYFTITTQSEQIVCNHYKMVVFICAVFTSQSQN